MDQHTSKKTAEKIDRFIKKEESQNSKLTTKINTQVKSGVKSMFKKVKGIFGKSSKE